MLRVINASFLVRIHVCSLKCIFFVWIRHGIVPGIEEHRLRDVLRCIGFEHCWDQQVVNFKRSPLAVVHIHWVRVVLLVCHLGSLFDYNCMSFSIVTLWG